MLTRGRAARLCGRGRRARPRRGDEVHGRHRRAAAAGRRLRSQLLAPERARGAARRGARRRRWPPRRSSLANPHALLSFDEFWSDVRKQEEAASGFGKLGLDYDSGRPLLPVGADVGLRLGAAGGGASPARCARLREDVRKRAVPGAVAARVHGLHGDAGALLRPLAAARVPGARAARRAARDVRAVDALRRAGRARARRWRRGGRGGCWRRRASSTASTSTACCRATTRATWRAPGWSRTSPAGRRSSSSRSCPTPGSPSRTSHDAADGSRAAASRGRGGAGSSSRPAARRSTTRAARSPGGKGRFVQHRGLRAHAAARAVDAYERGGYCWVVTGSTQYGRALAAPGEVPNAIAYYRDARHAAQTSSTGDRPRTGEGEGRWSSTSTGASTTTRAPTSDPGRRWSIYRLRAGRVPRTVQGCRGRDPCRFRSRGGRSARVSRDRVGNPLARRSDGSLTENGNCATCEGRSSSPSWVAATPVPIRSWAPWSRATTRCWARATTPPTAASTPRWLRSARARSTRSARRCT